MASKASDLILAGDIGGTKSNIATFKIVGGSLSLVRSQRYQSAGYPGLGAIIREYLGKEDPRFLAGCFGVPGPVHEGRAKPTNLSWGVDAAEISEEFEIPRVSVLNDLEANAYGISHLTASDFAIVQKGAPDAEGNRCVVSPGTGLGQAGLFWDGKRHRVWACEGGHTDFGPRNALEIALLEYLMKQFGHVSPERIVSGMGIENIYKFLRETGRGKELPSVAAEMKNTDPNVVISRYAASGECPMCVQTLEIFVGCLGAEASNMALKAMATGGVYLGGGIPTKLLARIQSVGFLHAFNDKGRLSSLMEAIPVLVILNDQTALLGAAHYALEGANAS
jgi:glucokinase